MTNDRRDENVEMRLREEYRAAWQSANDADQYAALYFVFDTRCSDGFDLIVEAIRQPTNIATDGAAIALVLLTEGFDLGPTIRSDLIEFRARFPASSFGDAAIAVLDDKEKSG